jgi:hypothetical protein
MIPLLEFERGPAGPQRPALPNIGIFEAQLEATEQGADLAPTRTPPRAGRNPLTRVIVRT